MAENKKDFDAMVVPKGARIIVRDGNEIELDVQGDLILQESQQGLTKLHSHHGSILIDEDVVVNTRSIRSDQKIRVRGKLESNDLKAESISIEGGKVFCEDLNTKELESTDGEIETNTIKADSVSIKGGSVEIGSIFAKKLNLANKVNGSILISNAKERTVDENVQIKGGFESDVELLGYLLKYRHQFMSDKVLAELKSRKEGREFKRFLIEDSGAEATDQLSEEDSDTIDVFASEEISDMEEETLGGEVKDDSEVVGEDTVAESSTNEVNAKTSEKPQAANEEVASKLNEFSEKLSPLLPEQQDQPAMVKLIMASLRQNDLKTLRAIYQRWADNLKKELSGIDDDAKEVIEEIGEYIDTVG